VYVRSYTQCRMIAVAGGSIVTHCHSLSPFAVALSCLSTLEGGGWALVRRVGQGSTWSSATDSLVGTASFGVTSSKPVDTTSLSIPFWQWLWPSTELLFATGYSAEFFGRVMQSDFDQCCRRPQQVGAHHQCCADG
jgi:hypothetical protein